MIRVEETRSVFLMKKNYVDFLYKTDEQLPQADIYFYIKCIFFLLRTFERSMKRLCATEGHESYIFVIISGNTFFVGEQKKNYKKSLFAPMEFI